MYRISLLRKPRPYGALLAVLMCTTVFGAGCAPATGTPQPAANLVPSPAEPDITLMSATVPGVGAPEELTTPIGFDLGPAANQYSVDQYGRPNTPEGLTRLVVQALHAEDVTVESLTSCIITAHDISRLGPNYDPTVDFSPSADTVKRIATGLEKMRHDGEAEGILWNDIQFIDASLDPETKTLTRFGETADVVIEVESRGNFFRFRLSKVQRTATAVVLTEGFSWMGERKQE